MKTRSRQAFTLIELVVVIAILGILAAVAIPKYIDLTDEAQEAHDRALLGGLRGATVLLYATNCLGGTDQYHTGYTNYWPKFADVSNSMSDVVAFKYWTNTVESRYDISDGSWDEGSI